MPYPVVEEYTFVEGIDPTSVWGSYATTLLQLIRQAIPNSYRGLIIYSSATPSVVDEFAWQKRCLWINSSTFNTYVYNNTLAKWIDITADIAIGAINDPNQIVDGVITLAKLNTVAPAGHVLQMDASGKLLVLRQLDQALAAGVISSDSTYGTQLFLVKDGALTRWQGVNPLALKDLSVPLPKIQYSGLQGQVLTVVPSGSGTALAFANPSSSGGTPTGAAGGSLAGSYPNPTLAITGVTPATYGGAGITPAITVNAEGRITAAQNVAGSSPYARMFYELPQGTAAKLKAVVDGTETTYRFVWSNLIDTGGIIKSTAADLSDRGLVTVDPGTYRIFMESPIGVSNIALIVRGMQSVAGGNDIAIGWKTLGQLTAEQMVTLVILIIVSFPVQTSFYFDVHPLTITRVQPGGSGANAYTYCDAANIAGVTERYGQMLVEKVG